MTVTKIARHGKPVTHIKDFAPRHIQCYMDMTAKAAGIRDYITVVFTKYSTWQWPRNKPKNPYIGRVAYIGLTEVGLYYHGELRRPGYFGKRVSFMDMPEACRRQVIEEYEFSWGIKITTTPEGCQCIGWEVNKDEKE
jgi:hypothetical protein